MKDIPTRYSFATNFIPLGVIYLSGMVRSNLGMDNRQIRITNLRTLADRAGGRPKLAQMLEMSYQLLQNYIGKTPTKRIGDRTARRAEEVFSLPHGWMDQPHDHSRANHDVSSGCRDWPFKIAKHRYDALPKMEKERSERALTDIIETWEGQQQQEVERRA